jgi:outer membrane protein TolC
VDVARQRVQLLRRPLAETDALLSFGAGNRPPAAAALQEQRRAVIEKELLPKAQAALKMSTEAYQVGEVDLDELLTWSQRVAELKRELARTPAEKRAALEAQREMLQDLRTLAEQRYKAAQAPVTDVLAIDYRIAELKLDSLDRGP